MNKPVDLVDLKGAALTGADAVVEMLKAHGVKVIFGLCGDTSLPLYDALARSASVRHILTRDERHAAYMADGYARVTGKVGVCEGPSGGGATYILPGLVEANESSIPVLAINTDVAVSSRNRFTLTELDQRSLRRRRGAVGRRNRAAGARGKAECAGRDHGERQGLHRRALRALGRRGGLQRRHAGHARGDRPGRRDRVRRLPRRIGDHRALAPSRAGPRPDHPYRRRPRGARHELQGRRADRRGRQAFPLGPRGGRDAEGWRSLLGGREKAREIRGVRSPGAFGRRADQARARQGFERLEFLALS